MEHSKIIKILTRKFLSGTRDSRVLCRKLALFEFGLVKKAVGKRNLLSVEFCPLYTNVSVSLVKHIFHRQIGGSRGSYYRIGRLPGSTGCHAARLCNPVRN